MSDSSRKIHKLTPEIIEATISQSSVLIHGDDLHEDLQEEIAVFTDLFKESELLQGEVLGALAVLFSSSDSPPTSESLPDLLRSGRISEEQFVRFGEACRDFLFIGWHARGAVEDAEDLEHLMGDDADASM